MNHKTDIVSEAAKAAPPVALLVVEKFAGLTLQDWVYIATLVYIALQAGWLLYRWWRAARSKTWTPTE